MAFFEEKNWKENPTELWVMALCYAFGFVTLKYLRRDKPPAKLRNLKLIYNAIMSIFSLYIFYGVSRLLVINYNRASATSKVNLLLCDNSMVLYDNMEWYFQTFYYSKYVEYVDTAFLVMAGVANPSLKMGLHLYHHLITPSIVFATWFYPCIGGWMGPLTNSIVHVIMYAYYGASVVFPNIKKYGNLVTYVQLVQFVTVITYHSVAILPNMWTCTCNKWQLAFNFGNYFIFLALFFLFLSKKNKSKEAEKTEVNGNVKQPLVKQE